MERGTDTRVDALLIGCATSLFLCNGQLPKGPWFKVFLSWGLLAVLGLCAMSLISVEKHGIMITVCWLLMSILVAVIILALMIAPGKASRLLLENPSIINFGFHTDYACGICQLLLS